MLTIPDAQKYAETEIHILLLWCLYWTNYQVNDKKHDKDKIIGLDLKQRPYMMVLFFDLAFFCSFNVQQCCLPKAPFVLWHCNAQRSQVLRVWSHRQRANDIDSNTYENGRRAISGMCIVQDRWNRAECEIINSWYPNSCTRRKIVSQKRWKAVFTFRSLLKSPLLRLPLSTLIEAYVNTWNNICFKIKKVHKVRWVVVHSSAEGLSELLIYLLVLCKKHNYFYCTYLNHI